MSRMQFIEDVAAVGIGADTGLCLMPVQYERRARAESTAIIIFLKLEFYGIDELSRMGGIAMLAVEASPCPLQRRGF